MVSGAAASSTFERTIGPSGIGGLIKGLESEETREQSLDLLSKNRQTCDNLAVLLWNSCGTMGLLLQVITSVYRPLLSDSLPEKAITQVCNAIALLQSIASHPDTRIPFIRDICSFVSLQSVASHPDTRIPFIRATMPVYLYPFLNTMSSERNYESLRLTSLGVVGSLAKADDLEVVDYLLSVHKYFLAA